MGTITSLGGETRMIKVKCYKCKKELNEPGALLFSPPIYIKGRVNWGTEEAQLAVDKFHICVRCYYKIMRTTFKKL